MRTPEYYGSFKKDRKLMKKQNKDMNKLNEVMGLLLNEQPFYQNMKTILCMETTRTGGNVMLNLIGFSYIVLTEKIKK